MYSGTLVRRILISVALGWAGATLHAQSGIVKSANQPSPGATVTVTSGSQHWVTTTDPNGRYTITGASAGDCAIEVQMFGFAPATKKMSCTATAEADFDLQLQESPVTQRLARMGANQGGGNPLERNLQSELTQPEAPPTPAAPPAEGQ